MTDELEHHDRVYLDKLRLATDVLMQAAQESDLVPDPLEVELVLLKDRIDRALLSTGHLTSRSAG